jgi:coproporphyrinogen III oxidase-like Fe-S oxidoreductase
MRTREGVERRDFRARFGIGFENAYGDIAHLVRGGFLIDDPDRVAFTDRGFRVSNAILSEWLDFGGDA